MCVRLVIINAGGHDSSLLVELHWRNGDVRRITRRTCGEEEHFIL